MTYDLTEHRHRLAAWAAARAAQRGFAADVPTLVLALEASGVTRYVATADLDDVNVERVDALHRQWCTAVVGCVPGLTFGRAAKLVSMYLKTVVVLGPATDTVFAHLVPPPIDSRLLKNLAAADDVVSVHKPAWRKTNWTQLDADTYSALVEQLRDVLTPREPFWMLERFWTVTAPRRRAVLHVG